ncbi:MAG: lipid A biosynthesis lauroyl acyltransferase [Lysobacterales bacterium CG17_big_fil_post_rev_8_21_14_2_50_64_11]|nr:MAG: lipid A biosynthesis lauroyl acyltransferase [Xanthomonadales bacterium CG17_big_fil_post_rev_8_21_14_2_50_64_11]PIX60328.1 MAG: lipid A biosynthesis lauroyl acyltransferase [Xanthomonadales bacterium CG_4_10_14_3_um_filter_64_11]
MNNPARPPFTPRNAFAWLGVAVLWLLAQLPWGMQRALGNVLGSLLFIALRKRRRIAARNLALCFPEHDDAARRQLLRAHFAALGVGVFEFARAWWGSIAPMRRHVRIEGLAPVQAILASGRGVLLVSGHFTTLELCGRLLCDHLPVSGMYRAHDSAPMEWAVRRGRLRYASAMYTREHVLASVRGLKRGGVLWYAPDQDMLGRDRVFAPFFAIAAGTITATHQLARLSGCAVVPFFHRREGSRYLIRLAPALADFPSADPLTDTTRINAVIEAMVRAAPTQYLWIHQRFKRRPPGAPALY